jgi:hypothetical protein
VVAYRNGRHAVTKLLDDSCALVAKHDRERVLRYSRYEVPVGVADAARLQPHGHLFRARRCEVEVLDREGLVDGPENGGSHRAIVCRPGL